MYICSNIIQAQAVCNSIYVLLTNDYKVKYVMSMWSLYALYQTSVLYIHLYVHICTILCVYVHLFEEVFTLSLVYGM